MANKEVNKVSFSLHWKQPSEIPQGIFTRICDDACIVLPALEQLGGFKLTHQDGTQTIDEPAITTECIRLNGDLNKGEEFVFARKTQRVYPCETEGHPYSLAAKAVLYIAHTYLGDDIEWHDDNAIRSRKLHETCMEWDIVDGNLYEWVNLTLRLHTHLLVKGYGNK